MNAVSTREAAKLLGIKVGTLSRAVWEGRIDAPSRSPAGDYLWNMRNIEQASWVLLHQSYVPQKEAQNG